MESPLPYLVVICITTDWRIPEESIRLLLDSKGFSSISIQFERDELYTIAQFPLQIPTTKPESGDITKKDFTVPVRTRHESVLSHD